MKKTLIIITLTLFLALAVNSQATPYNQSNWYLTVDIKQLKSKVIPLLHVEKKGKRHFSIDDNIPEQVNQITLYGHSEADNDLSVAITGNFTNYSLQDFITELMYQIEEESPVNLTESSEYKGRTIEQYAINENNEQKYFYSSKVNNDLLVISFDQTELKNWIDDKYDINELSNSGLVSILVNIESAMAHMGADLKSNDRPFNSAVFQKITQFSASMYESSTEILTIESALSTADEATAKQLEQVINGLIAMNALSNLDQDNKVLKALLGALEISNHGSELLISTELPFSVLTHIDVN